MRGIFTATLLLAALALPRAFGIKAHADLPRQRSFPIWFILGEAD